VVQHLGVDAALALLQETLQVEAQGGLLVSSGRRRRTPGGVFLYLAKQRLPGRDRRAVFWPGPKRKKKKPAGTSAPSAPSFRWADRLDLAREAWESLGEATTVKVTLIGRPGRVVERGDVVLTTLRGGNPPALPTRPSSGQAGLPAPPAEPTTYIVLIARRPCF
jgi:hypothetical protein